MQELSYDDLIELTLSLREENGVIPCCRFGPTKRLVERAVAECSATLSGGSSVQIEMKLEPIFRILALLPESERGGCIHFITKAFNGWAPSEFSLSQKIASYEQHLVGSASSAKIVVSDVETLLRKDVQAQRSILGPWFVEQSIALVHAWRGTGKSLFVLNSALAMATGGTFLKWHAPTEKRVLLIDGELPEAPLQERLGRMIKASKAEPKPANFQISYLDVQPSRQLPNLATPLAQAQVNTLMQNFDVLILDNLACLFHFGRENEAESWQPVRTWLLQLRAAGKSVILVHHSGKNGTQRGTSAKEDIVDTVISLRRPQGDTDGSNGARFEVHFEKSRHFWGAHAEPFLAQCNGDDVGWSFGPVEFPLDTKEEVQRFKSQGYTRAETARQLGVNRSTVGRHW